MNLVCKVCYFVTNRDFRESQSWVNWIGEICSFILPANGWTSTRFSAPIIPFLNLDPCLELFAYVLLLSTDAIDGLVARIRNKKGKILGAMLDGAADQTLMLTAFISVISRATNMWLIVTLIIVEIFFYVTIFSVKHHEASRKGEGLRLIFCGKNGRELLKHTGIRKFKFVVQGALLVFSEIGIMLKVQSGLWTDIVTWTMLFVIALSVWSAVQKICELKKSKT